ncbi:Dynein heavy chain 1, axonemal [Cichlidogyrus casuarinus]|uniref:Dynein heavy chain 1, axonemal n=1 Tax=Cichlidogyrus casuarinus TaxID=1844966 RepID=A0ABD2QFQ8_9PLAT
MKIVKKKREYTAINIQDYLAAEFKISSQNLVPKKQNDKDSDQFEKSLPYLDLEIFDNEDYEVRSPADWVKLGMDASVLKPIPAVALLPIADDRDPSISWKWIFVGVLNYNSKKNWWLVQKVDEGGKILSELGQPVYHGSITEMGEVVQTNTQYWVPRIQLMFMAEDPKNFAKRVAEAYKSRQEVEATLKYHLYLDCMPGDNLSELDNSTLKRITKMARSASKILSESRTNLEKQIQLDYLRSMNDLVLREAIKERPDVFNFVKLPRQAKKKKILRGTYDIPSYEFDKVYDQFAFTSMLTRPEVIETRNRVQFECLEASRKLLFQTPVTKPLRLEEFEQVQQQATLQVAMFLKDQWPENLRRHIRSSLRDVGKGWFNLHETEFYVYTKSKLKKFMELTKYAMQDTLRFLVNDSLNSFVSMIGDACLPCTKLPSDFIWESNLIASNKNPIFVVELNMDVDSAKFVPSLDKFQELAVNLFNKAINSVQQIAQIEKTVLTGISWADTPLLEAVGMYEPEVRALRDSLISLIDSSKVPLSAYAQKYKKYLDLHLMDMAQFIIEYDRQGHKAEEIKAEVELQLRYKDEIEREIPTNIVIGPFLVQTENLKQNLSKKRKSIANAILDLLAKQLRIQADRACDAYRTISSKLNEKPATIEDLVEMRTWIETIPTMLEEHQEVIDKAMADYELIEEFFYNLSAEDFTAKWTAIGYPFKIRNLIDTVNLSLAEDEEKFRRLQIQDMAIFADKLDSLAITIASMASYMDVSKAQEIANEVRKTNRLVLEYQQNALIYNNRERLFNMNITSTEKLQQLAKEFEPYKNFWLAAADWLKMQDQVLNDALMSVDPEAVKKTLNESHKIMHKSIKIFQDLQSVQEVAMNLKLNIEEFKPFLPLLESLRNPGMRVRHWEILSEKLNMQIVPNASLTLTKVLEMGLQDHLDTITGISSVAGKEYEIERALNMMTKDWEKIKLDVIPYKNTGTNIVKISEEINQMIDDHIVMTQQLSFDPNKKPFEARITEWEGKLRMTQDVFEEWTACQRQWLYLEPIFSSEDINRQLPVEAKRYATMDRIWRKVMKAAQNSTSVMTFCPDARLLTNLKECNKLLEAVLKGLSEYLEAKRQAFPRFFFLSDDELLEILSQTKDPTAVQPHLRKCFENIAKLRFEEDLEITAMFSGEGEMIPYEKTTYPTGNVEEWMLEIENLMRYSLRNIIAKALAAYKCVKREQWVLEWPGQVVIAVCQTYWTAEVTQALVQNGHDGLTELYPTLLKQLDGLRELVKTDLTKSGRMTLSALIVIEVHARDVVANMVAEKVANANDFEWISQLRYEWRESEEQLKIRAVNAEFQYGYEYLGNSPRLVITPLTDRCYLTLTGALHLKFGGAPAGPAGTGKTETTKDLGKAFAIQCVVFNCSDQLDFMAMGKFFKGLAAAGAWACFDEFNRIDIEVLSVIAQQITTIQKALLQRAEQFFFEGVEMAIKSSCAVFITMNPGYAGRTELPDNLKALFRPVAMMVPDYALIAEISLFSFGFADSRLLSKKITTTFKLSSEQLSSQDHYDFGMRAVKSVISAAGNLKRQNPNMDEELICLRAIRDVNVPKFLIDDLTLFSGIISDLFPNIKEEPIDYGYLMEALKHQTIKQGLKPVNGFIEKCIQLYETTVVRHGLMLVGPTGSGKTKCYVTLQRAMSSLKGKPAPDGSDFQTVHCDVLNPKSITMGQLYGEFDMMTHEWTDGILSTLIREGCAAANEDKRWYMFDGPVDAVWIENMNTVLDDNKKLCLSSGEIIKLTDQMTMMFEVADLAVASPATVSRCGMVYLEPGIFGLDPFFECWLKKLPESVVCLATPYQTLIKNYFKPMIKFVRENLRELVPSTDGQLTFNFLRLLECLYAPFEKLTDKVPGAQLVQAAIKEIAEMWFTFALIWSLGSTCDNNGRKLFDQELRALLKNHNADYPLPQEGLVFDYQIDDAGNLELPSANPEDEETTKKGRIHWVQWSKNMVDITITETMKYSDIIVPTIDTIRNNFLLELMAKNRKNVLCIGPTGTGKSILISDKLQSDMPKNFLPEFIVFSAKTNANQTQDLIDSKLDKRRRGYFAPPIGRTMVFFIDDLNMPAQEVYGAQPPIELLRQWMDFGGWYDRKVIGEFKNIIDVTFVGAMGPPGGGRNPVTQRLLRHFNYISFNELERDSMTSIFNKIITSWINFAAPDKPAKTMLPVCHKLVQASIDNFLEIQNQMLPTPLKSHYTFNLRDLAKVFQGILMFDSNSLGGCTEELLSLWYHESCRVFQDRLVDDADRDFFKNLIVNRMVTMFEMKFEEVVAQDPLLYGDFINSAVPVENRKYGHMDKLDRVGVALTEYMEDYNQMNTAKMDLVLFVDAVKHLCRISRILRQPQGNALLLGMGGSGRQSLTRLAAHVSEFECIQIELSKNYSMTDWRDDLKRVMTTAGVNNQPVVFLFSDTQIKSESFLEDLNNILNSGDVPNIYAIDDQEKIYNAMKPVASDLNIQPTKTNLFALYKKRVRENLHTVVSMSPIGDIFRARLRQFPALDMPDLDVSDATMSCMVAVCQYMHRSVVQRSRQYLAELSRHIYVTPTSYLTLLSVFSKIYGLKKETVQTAKNRTKAGLDKLLYTEEVVNKLQEELELMRPELERAVEESKVTMEEIARDSKIAEETASVVGKEEEAASKKAKECQAIKDDAQHDLDEALPALEASLEALNALNKNDIVEVRAMMRPPEGVRLVMETVCIMFDVKPKKVPGEKPGQKIDDYWEPGKPLLQDPGNFIASLKNYDRDNITEAIITKVSPYIDSPNFMPAAIAKVSKACTSICMWVRAMHKYHHVAKSVAPKRAALKASEIELEATEKQLKEARSRLKACVDRINGLKAKYDECIHRQHELEDKSRLCEARLVRADKLITGLGSEKARWKDQVVLFDELLNNLVGDVLMSAGYVAYLGPFVGSYRNMLSDEWLGSISANNVPHTASPAPNLVCTFGDPVKIRNWHIFGLPKDVLSIENATIAQFSRRWPVFIDPQGQANRWIRQMENANGLVLMKMSDKDFLRNMENAIRFGRPCLLENVGEELDPALEPILLKQTFKQQGSTVIKLGDSIVPYNEDFKLYITTKLPNPHYKPEVSTKVNLINFTLSPSGLEDQLLGIVVAEERPDLEDAKNQLIVSNAKMKQELKEIEDRILERLSSSEGSPVIVAEQTEKDIDDTRCKYIPVSIRTRILFFCVSDLGNIDPMYQYSLEWFINIFVNSIRSAEKGETLPKRVENINNNFTFRLYSNVCRSLFEKHKLLFAFLVTIRILMNDGKVNMDEWRFLLAGATGAAEELANPAPEWITDRIWGDFLSLSLLPAFASTPSIIGKSLDRMKEIFDSLEPHREPLPCAWEEHLDSFQKLLILRCLRSDKLTNAMQDFVAAHLGQVFIEPQTTSLSEVFKDSSPTTPLIFILSTGTDPASELYKFADEMKFGAKKLSAISLGQGQGPRAEELMRLAMERGIWVFFQNCHLAPSWMPSLERLVEQIDKDRVHKDFRLWLTSMPSDKFPVYILQNGSKMTVEPPKGIKANLMRTYLSINDQYFTSCGDKTHTFKHLLLSLAFFNGVLVERKKFGPLGFNIPYEFTTGDLKICMDQLVMFLNEYQDVPYKVLRYTAGHINYGGRVTDDWDRRCMMNILNDFYNSAVLKTEHDYSNSLIYRQIDPESDHAGYMAYIHTIPLNDMPEVFGLHENANITFAQNETFAMLTDLLKLQPKSAGSGDKSLSREEMVENLANQLLEQCPKLLPAAEIAKQYPIMYEQSMNTVLNQEVIKYNRLLATIQQSLKDLIKAIKGLVVMNASLEAMMNALFDNRVPIMWANRAYPSLKPLAAWVVDLQKRMEFIENWVNNGIPAVFWISGFFFPQAFLTGTLQNYARKMQLSIDTISFDFQVMKVPFSKLEQVPEDGCFIRGLYIEGARWDYERHLLGESRPRELYTNMACIWLKPKSNRQTNNLGVYECPVYKTITRAGTLSTTGLSTNFVFAIEIPTSEPASHWIKRGVAMLCALNY